jgi:hypothetical protein
MIFPANEVWQDSFDRVRHATPHIEASRYQTSPPVVRTAGALRLPFSRTGRPFR